MLPIPGAYRPQWIRTIQGAIFIGTNEIDCAFIDHTETRLSDGLSNFSDAAIASNIMV